MKPEGYRFHAHTGHTCPAELVFVAEVGEVAEIGAIGFNIYWSNGPQCILTGNCQNAT